MKKRIHLFDSYYINQVENNIFEKIYNKLVNKFVTPDYTLCKTGQNKSCDPTIGQSDLVINWLIYYQDEIIGWCHGRQMNNDCFYMKNTGIKKDFRGKGIYSKVLTYLVSYVFNYGFSVITSKHIATNNSVLVPKLKQGFIITGVEMTIDNGLLVSLSLFKDKTNHQIMDFRCGFGMPSRNVKALLDEIITSKNTS